MAVTSDIWMLFNGQVTKTILYIWSVSLATFVVFFPLIKYVWKMFIAKYEKQEIPGLKTIPLLGNALHFERRPEDFFKQVTKWMKQNNNNMILWVGPVPFLLTAKVDHAEVLLKDTRILSKSQVYRFLHPWLDTGLLTSTGEKWRKRRKMLTPAFHFGILRDSVKVFKNEAEKLVDKLMPHAQSGQVFDIAPYIALCTLDVICETAMGVKIKAQEGQHVEYVEAVAGLSRLIQNRQKSPWLWPRLMYALSPSGWKHSQYLSTLHNFTTRVINEKITSRNNEIVQNSKKTLAFMDILLDSFERDEIDIPGVKEETDTFMFEGYDTTTQGIIWCLYLLGWHPDIQRKVQEEVDAHLVDGWDGFVESLEQMKLLARVVKESLRLYPSVPIIGREVEEDMQLGNGLNVHKGTTIILVIRSLHRNPDVWENPDKFDPDRFLPENCTNRHSFAYVPFSAGPRNCIGQKFALLELKVVLATLLRHFEFTSLQKEEDLDLTGELTMKAQNAVRMKVKMRNHDRKHE